MCVLYRDMHLTMLRRAHSPEVGSSRSVFRDTTRLRVKPECEKTFHYTTTPYRVDRSRRVEERKSVRKQVCSGTLD